MFCISLIIYSYCWQYCGIKSEVSLVKAPTVQQWKNVFNGEHNSQIQIRADAFKLIKTPKSYFYKELLEQNCEYLLLLTKQWPIWKPKHIWKVIKFCGNLSPNENLHISWYLKLSVVKWLISVPKCETRLPEQRTGMTFGTHIELTDSRKKVLEHILKPNGKADKLIPGISPHQLQLGGSSVNPMRTKT